MARVSTVPRSEGVRESTGGRWFAAILAVLLLAPGMAGAEEREDAEAPVWQPLGLVRVRDMTPFGISRLDMLPAHAVPATPGTLGVEVAASYQNTWAMSANVREYLEARGTRRGEITPAEVADLVALPGDAYLVDGELGLLDVTLHYRASEHFGIYATLPYFTFSSGFLDPAIESFHDTFGFSTAGRDLAPRNRFLAVADLQGATVVIDDAPRDELGDPVIGGRYSMRSADGRWGLIVEGAIKWVLFDSERLTSTGANDLGLQLSLQRFLRRNAFYLSLATVYYQSPDTGLSRDLWIPTLVAGWETRLRARSSFIAQLYVSDSNIQDTPLAELAATKVQATLGLQWVYRGIPFRFAITENVANFQNTPDIGFNLSFAWIRPPGPARSD